MLAKRGEWVGDVLPTGAKPVAMFTPALRKAGMHCYGGLQYLTPLVIVEPIV